MASERSSPNQVTRGRKKKLESVSNFAGDENRKKPQIVVSKDVAQTPAAPERYEKADMSDNNESKSSSASSEDRQERTEGLIMTDDQYNKIRTILMEHVSHLFGAEQSARQYICCISVRNSNSFDRLFVFRTCLLTIQY